MRFAFGFVASLSIFVSTASVVHADTSAPMLAAPLVMKKNGQDWSSLAPALLKKKDFQGLLELAQQWVESEPGSAFARLILGVAHSNLKQHEQAVQAYREALRIQPENVSAWYNLGVAHGKLKQYDQAVPALREALRIQSENASVWYNLGLTYNNLKQYDQAIQAYREALRIQPEYVDAWYDLSLA